MKSKTLVLDFLFGFQLTCCIVFGIFQAIKMLSSTEGVSLSMFATAAVFAGINVYLADASHRFKRSRLTKQTLIIYWTWGLVLLAHVGICLTERLITSDSVWEKSDTTTVLIVLAGVLATLLVARSQNLTIADPVVKGYVALFFKALPQFIWAYTITQVGHGGISPIMLIMGHLTMITRIVQIMVAIKEAGVDRNRRGLLVSELGNWLSWITATTAYLL